MHSFAFYGNGMPELMEKIDSLTSLYKNVSSHGRFNSSTDLESIYSNIDILICCYDVTNTNVRLAEPNKLYESIFFNKPIVVSEGTYLGDKVKKMGVGFTLNAEDEKAIENLVECLSLEGINQAIRKMEEVPTLKLIDNGNELVNIIERRTFNNE